MKCGGEGQMGSLEVGNINCASTRIGMIKKNIILCVSEGKLVQVLWEGDRGTPWLDWLPAFKISPKVSRLGTVG